MVITASEIRKIQSLYAACIVGDLKGVVTILNAHLHDIDGNNIHAIDIDPKGYGRRPIHAATIGGHLDIVKFLIDNGADVNIKNRYGDTALHFAVYHNRSLILTELLKRHADPTIQNNVYKTPIDIAKEESKEQFVIEMENFLPNTSQDTRGSMLKQMVEKNKKP